MSSSRGRPFLAGGLLVALVGGLTVYRHEVVAGLSRLDELVAWWGPAAPLALAFVAGVWGVLCLPGPLMQASIATLWANQPWLALAVVMAGETLAQATSFTLARWVGREPIRQRLAHRSWFTRLEKTTSEKGFYGVLVFRLMPFFPNAPASYGFGLTGLPFVAYLVASFLGSVPKMVVYIFGATSAIQAVRTGDTGLLLGLGVALTVVLGAWWRFRRTALPS